MIADDQFAEFAQYVTDRLGQGGTFMMPREEFEAFGFTRPFYSELARRVEVAGNPFTMKGHYTAPDGDPSHVDFFPR